MKKMTSWILLAVLGLGFSLAHAQNNNNAPEVASTLYAINKGEIETSQLAKNKTTNRAVLDFANQMITEHQNAQNQLDTILKNENINKITSADARTLNSQARKTMRMLKKLNGIAFDRAYMDYQITAHKNGLQIINDHVLPRVQNPALKNYALELKQHVARHLAEAEKLRPSI